MKKFYERHAGDGSLEVSPKRSDAFFPSSVENSVRGANRWMDGVDAGKSPKQAIKAWCIICSGGEKSEAKACDNQECVFFPYAFRRKRTITITVERGAKREVDVGRLLAAKKKKEVEDA